MRVHAPTHKKVFAAARVIGGIAFFILIALVIVRVFTHALPAEAASSTYYPNFCLGDWQYPQRASGPAAVGPGSDPSDYTIKNSAYLESSVAAQIFCGYFSVKDAKNPPKEVLISFNWNMAFATAATSTPKPDTYETIEDGPIIPPESGYTPEPPATSTDPVPPPVVPPVTPPSTDTPPPPETPNPPENPPANPPPPSDNPPPSEPNPPAPTPPVVPVTPSDPPPADTSFNLQTTLASIFASPVQAAEVTVPLSNATNTIALPPGSISANDFLEVSYSLDGTHWKPAGRVTRENWKNFYIIVPVESWEDIRHIQLTLTALSSINEKPDIYLDSIALRVRYDRTFTELASQSLAAVNSAIDSFLGGSGSGDDSADEEPVPAPPEVKAPEPPPPSYHDERSLVFELAGKRIDTHTELPWYSDEFLKRVQSKTRNIQDIQGKVSKEGKSLVLEGNCSMPYYVVLMFSTQDDYIRQPAKAVSNIARACKFGSFNYDHNAISSMTPEGDYYIMIAEEDAQGPWIPISRLIPIHITAQVERIEDK